MLFLPIRKAIVSVCFKCREGAREKLGAVSFFVTVVADDEAPDSWLCPAALVPCHCLALAAIVGSRSTRRTLGTATRTAGEVLRCISISRQSYPARQGSGARKRSRAPPELAADKNNKAGARAADKNNKAGARVCQAKGM